MTLTSPAFKPGDKIPVKYTCDGQDVSPALAWTDPPANTKSFALLNDDPDAPVGDWVHWIVFNIGPEARQLAEAVEVAKALPGALAGRTDFGHTRYGGPCPPPGKPHRYFFKLYALDVKLNLKAGATKKELLTAMEGYILAQVELMGKYGR